MPPFPGCPSLHATDRDTYIIVGAVVNLEEVPELRNRVAADEVVVEVPQNLIDRRMS